MFFPLSFLFSSYLSSSPLRAFRGALTTAFLLGTCLKGSRSMWCPLTIRYGCFLLALTSQATKDSFSTGTNFSFQIINRIQTLSAVQAMWVQKPREDHILEEKGQRKGREMEKKNLIKRQDVLFGVVQCQWILYQTPIQMVWSSFLLSLLSPSLSSSSFHQDGPCNEAKLWSLQNGQRFAALMNGRNTRRAECSPSFLFASHAKAPGCLLKKASSIHCRLVSC